MDAKAAHNIKKIIRNIYLFLPFTLLKQKLAFRLRKPPAGLPDFLCIGAQKAGTTWLHDQLLSCDRVELARVKEVHYFDWYFHRPLSWYISNFPGLQQKIRGEITPGYSIIETGRVKFIHRIMPDVKIILILRDPRERAWSAARYHFGTVLGKPLNDITEKNYFDYLNQNWVQQRGDYVTIWNKWASVFPKDQLLLLFNEDIAKDPFATLGNVCNFLGVPTPEMNDGLFARPNKSKEAAIPPNIKKYLDDLYKPEVKKLEVLLKRDLSAWKS